MPALMSKSLCALFILLNLSGGISVAYAKSKMISHSKSEADVAILIGINYQERDKLNRLNYAEKDMKTIGNILRSHGYTVHDELLGYNATKSSILSTIQSVVRQYQQGGNLLVFFSGHGFTQADTNYLVASDTTLQNLSQTGLAIHEVAHEMKVSNFARKMLFIDACRNDPGKVNHGLVKKSFGTTSKDVKIIKSYQKNPNDQGINILYSTGYGSYSFEDTRLGHGVFSYYLIEALKNAASGVFFDALAKRVSKNVRNWVYEKYKETQIPFRSGESTGDFVIIKPPGYEAPESEAAALQNKKVEADMHYQKATRLLMRNKTEKACSILQKIVSVDTRAAHKHKQHCH